MRRNALRIASVILKLALAVLYLAPTWMVLVNSFKEKKLANKFGTSLPQVWKFSNYADVFKSSNIPRAFLNGVVISCGSVLLIVLLGSLAAFVIARSDSKLVRSFYYVFLAGLVIPVAFIPTYLVLNTFKLLNTYPGLILISATYGLPMSIFMYVGFVKTVPRDLDEAGIIDGCTPLSLYWRVVFPLLKPATVSCVITQGLWIWNDYFFPMVFVSKRAHYSLPVGMIQFLGDKENPAQWNVLFASCVLCALPLVVVFMLLQKQFVNGIAAGAVKG